VGAPALSRVLGAPLAHTCRLRWCVDRDIINQSSLEPLEIVILVWRKVAGPYVQYCPAALIDEPPLLAVLLVVPGRAQGSRKIMLIAKTANMSVRNQSLLLITLFFSSIIPLSIFIPCIRHLFSRRYENVKGQREKSASLGRTKRPCLYSNSIDRRVASGWESGKHLIFSRVCTDFYKWFTLWFFSKSAVCCLEYFHEYPGFFRKSSFGGACCRLRETEVPVLLILAV